MKKEQKIICKYCGGEILPQLIDDEGNFRNEDYLLDPYSGIWYVPIHDITENPSCPIAMDEELGYWLYKTKKELAEAFK